MYSNSLTHYGVLGMKWGVRKDGMPQGWQGGVGINRKKRKQAYKDAKEYSRAKVSTGEGAGNRRKQIKAVVEQRMKDPEYKKLFEKAFDERDKSKDVANAKRWRTRKDVAKASGAFARGMKNLITKTGAPVATSALIAFGGYKYLQAHPEIKAAAKVYIDKVLKTVIR